MRSVVDIIKELEATSSRNEKIRILEQNKENQILRDTLFLTYNTFLNFYIQKLPRQLKKGDRTYEEKFPELKLFLLMCHHKQISGNKAIQELVKIVEQMNSEAQNLVRQMLKRKFTKAGINVKTINKVFPGLIPELNIQLANTFDHEKLDKYPESFVATPKLDGIRCIYFSDFNSYASGLYTRHGKRIENLPQIEKECEEVCNKFGLEFLDGELWTDQFDFNTIQSAVMSNKTIKSDLIEHIKLNVFACNLGQNSIEMMQHLDKILLNAKYLRPLDWTVVKKDLISIASKTLNMIKDGFEGLMLRNVHKPYSWKRDDNLLKVKGLQLLKMRDLLPGEIRNDIDKYCKLELDDFIITDVVEGDGQFKGMLGAIVVEGTFNGRKIATKVGSGFSLEERKELWNKRNKIIGAEAVILCQEVTKDNSLRFPTVKQIKLDRNKAHQKSNDMKKAKTKEATKSTRKEATKSTRKGATT